jgi:hypothetical protein
LSTDTEALSGFSRAVATLVLLFALAGCAEEIAVSPQANAFVVHAVLDAGSDNQYVVLQRTLGNTPTQQGVSGATVQIITPAGKVMTATETRDSIRVVPTSVPANRIAYRLRLSDWGERLLPGADYSLRIRVSGAEEITGTTRIPGDSSKLSVPVNTDTMALDFSSFDLSWPHLSLTTKYQVSVMGQGRQYFAFADSAHSIARDLWVYVPNNFGVNSSIPLFYTGNTYDVVVLALDANYYHYYRPRADLQSEALASGVHGALGVFGSVSRVLVRRVYLQ